MKWHPKISQRHYEVEGCRERMPVSQWRKIVSAGLDTLVFEGKKRKLIAENIGHGVVEVFKYRE